MRHFRSEQIADRRHCIIYAEQSPEYLIIQPVDSHDETELDEEIAHLETASAKAFVFIAIRIAKWNAELTPWAAPPVFGKIPFGDGAADTLLYIRKLAESVCSGTLALIGENGENIHFSSHTKKLLGGYSLAGFFALWAGYQTDFFDGITAVSPSVWFQGWLDYAAGQHPKTAKVYLSLGDKEANSKNKLMATVAECMARQVELLDEQDVTHLFEWNSGNHFQDNGIRTAKGFAWLMR